MSSVDIINNKNTLRAVYVPEVVTGFELQQYHDYIIEHACHSQHS